MNVIIDGRDLVVTWNGEDVEAMFDEKGTETFDITEVDEVALTFAGLVKFSHNDVLRITLG